jgi:hypothetical protein
MCVVSNVGVMGQEMWPNPFNTPWQPYVPGSLPQFPQPSVNPPYNGPTREQFEEFLKLMRQAKKLDESMGAADCESAAKVAWLKGLADYLGCDVSDLIK